MSEVEHHESAPLFEGHPVDGMTVKMSGATPVADKLKDVLLQMDDVVQMLATFKVVGIHHNIDKEGKLIRTAILRPVEMDLHPLDPNDPNDIGIIRAMPFGEVTTGVDTSGDEV